MIATKTIRAVVAATFPEDDKTKWEQVSKSNGYGGIVRTYRNTGSKRRVDITEGKGGVLTVVPLDDISKVTVVEDIEAHLRAGLIASTQAIADVEFEELLGVGSVWKTSSEISYLGMTIPIDTLFEVSVANGGHIIMNGVVAGIPAGTRWPVTIFEDKVTPIRLGAIRRLVILKAVSPRSYSFRSAETEQWTADPKKAEFFTSMSELIDYASDDLFYAPLDVNSGNLLAEPMPVTSYTKLLLKAEAVSHYPNAKGLYIDNVENNLGYMAMMVSEADLGPVVKEAGIENHRIATTDAGSAVLLTEMDAMIIQFSLPEGALLINLTTGEPY